MTAPAPGAVVITGLGIVCAIGADVEAFEPALREGRSGIRPAGESVSDHKRAMTPSEAIAAGATQIVVGRPIRDAADPRGKAQAIVDELAGSF